MGYDYTCEHGTQFHNCVKCKKQGKDVSGICDHFKMRSYCLDCKWAGTGGTAICAHDRNKYYCRDCKILGRGGNRICVHLNDKNYCRECKIAGIGGNYLCRHYRSKYTCRDCPLQLKQPKNNANAILKNINRNIKQMIIKDIQLKNMITADLQRKQAEPVIKFDEKWWTGIANKNDITIENNNILCNNQPITNAKIFDILREIVMR